MNFPKPKTITSQSCSSLDTHSTNENSSSQYHSDKPYRTEDADSSRTFETAPINKATTIDTVNSELSPLLENCSAAHDNTVSSRTMQISAMVNNNTIIQTRYGSFSLETLAWSLLGVCANGTDWLLYGLLTTINNPLLTILCIGNANIPQRQVHNNYTTSLIDNTTATNTLLERQKESSQSDHYWLSQLCHSYHLNEEYAFQLLCEACKTYYQLQGLAYTAEQETHCIQRIQIWKQRLQAHAYPTALEALDYVTNCGKQWIITPNDSAWPQRLQNLQFIERSAPPCCLWGQGNRSACQQIQQSAGVVGARNINHYGRWCTYECGSYLAQRGITVISGGAMGADAQAHWSTLDYCDTHNSTHIPTIAIMAGSVDCAGPSRNLELFEKIQSEQGALLSELPPHTPPLAHRFLNRNRLIAALSDTIIVTQARSRSGALNTAQWGNELCRQVLAIPGAINSSENAGCNRLIAEHKAEIITEIQDLGNFLTDSLANDNIQ